MGGIKRRTNKFIKPKKLRDKKRIESDKQLVEKYGLKNNKEIWKAEYRIKKIRNLAKKMITKTEEEQNKFIQKYKNMGFKIENIGEILALKSEDYLKRRLQTIVYKKGLARTIKEARQLVVHKKILVDKRIVDVPSYFINAEEENKIEKLK